MARLKEGASTPSAGLVYLGTWNAATNTPAIASGVGTDANYYIVNVPGSTSIDGISSWDVGDWIIFSAAAGAWQKIDNSDKTFVVDWAAGANYDVNDLVRAETRLYRSLTQHTALGTFNADRAAWEVVKELVNASFVATTYYYANDIVTESNRYLKRLTAGLSGASFTNAEAANWTFIGQSSYNAWVASKYYYAGEKVTFGGRILQKIADGISGATFDVTEAGLWTPVTPAPTNDWVASTLYYANEDVYQNGMLISRIATGVSTATFDATELADWNVKIVGGDIGTWTLSTFYEAGQLVMEGTRLLKRTATGTSAATFNADATNWTVLKQINIGAFAATTYYYADELVIQGTRTLKRTADGISGASFTNAEAALWTLVSNDVISAWTATTYYYQGELVTNGNRLLSKNASGVSTGTFDSTEGVLWTYISKQYATNWTATTYYYLNEPVLLNNALYVATAAFTSSATLNTAEIANWNRVQVSTKVQTIADTNTTITDWNRTILSGVLTANRTLNIATAVGFDGQYIEVKKTGSDAFVLTIDANGAETIDGATTYLLTEENQSVILRSDGVNVKVVATLGLTYPTIQTVTAAGTTVISIFAREVRGDTTLGNQTFTIPTAVGNAGKYFEFKKITSDTNTLTIDPTGAETIDGFTTYTLYKYNDAIGIRSNGANWDIVYDYFTSALVTSLTATATISPTPQMVLVTPAGASIINLPTAVGVNTGLTLGIKKLGNSTNDVTIDPFAAETIDGFTTIVLKNQNEGVLIRSNGTGWDVVSSHLQCFTTDNSITASTTLVNDHLPERIVTPTMSAAAQILSLPLASLSRGKSYAIANAGANTFTVNETGGATNIFNLGGGGLIATVSFPQYGAGIFRSNGVNWILY